MENGGLIKGVNSSFWRHSQNGFMPLFSTATMNALVKLKLAKFDRLIDGRQTFSLT